MVVTVDARADEDSQAQNSSTLKDKGDAIQKRWSGWVLNAANGLDSFFGNDWIEDDAEQTRVKLRLDFDQVEGLKT